MSKAATLTLTGSFRPESFARFVRDRAQLLSLAAIVRHRSRDVIVVAVEGEPDLVDAFEMACSLGPPDALVHDVAVQVGAPPGEVLP